jgi:hypothetical protein
MGYQPRIKSPQASVRGYRKPRHEKGKDRERKHGSVGLSIWGEKHFATMEEVSDRTLKRIRILGSQRFGSSPFRVHFDRWLMNLTDVLVEFESNPNINVDYQFVKERSHLLSIIELELEKRRRNEVSLEESIKNLSNSENLLELVKDEYAARARELKKRKNCEIKRVYSIIEGLRGELDDLVRTKTGLFRGISKKAREQKERETIHELNSRQRELELVMADFSAMRENLRDEYEEKLTPVIEQIRDRQKKLEILETDGSLEDRWFACETLLDAVNAFLQRKTLPLH